MAKTTSQIVKENKIRQQKVQGVVKSTKAINDAQLRKTGKTSSEKTLAILNKAIAGANDAARKSDAEKAKKLAVDSYRLADALRAPMPQTAREEQFALKKAPLTTKQRADNAQKAYDDYTKTDEYKKAQQEANKKALDDAMSRILMAPGVPASDIPIARSAPADPKERELKAVVDAYNQKMDQEESQRIQDADMKEIESWSDEDREQLRQYISSDSKTSNIFVNSNPLLWFGANKSLGDSAKYLYGKYGEEKTKQLASSYSRYLNEDAAEKIEEDTKNAVNESAMSATGQNVIGIGTRLFGGLQATVDRFGEALDRDERYPTLAPYTSGDLMSLHGNTVTAQTAQNIAGDAFDSSGQQIKDGGIVRQGAAYLYRGGMTMVDSFARSVAGGGPGGAAAIAACNSFSQTVSDASQRGATPEQAYTLGAAVAGIEYLSEKIPMDRVFKLAKAGDTKVLANIFKQAGIEISTEELSLIGTLAAEAAILQEKSEYNRMVEDAIANGASYEEAREQADRAILAEVGDTAIVSGLSGSFSAASAQVVGNINSRDAFVKPTDKDAAQAREEILKKYTPEAQQQPQTQDEGQRIIEDTAQQLSENAPPAEPPVPLTEGQKHIDNAAAELFPAQETPEQKEKDAWMIEMFNRQNAAREAEAKRASDRQAQKQVYEDLQAAKREQKRLAKEIEKAETKLRETGKGSQARIDQLKTQLEQQNKLVSQIESQNDYFGGEYETNVADAVAKQREIFESARAAAVQAIADHENGLITDAQLQAANDTYNNAGQELYRLKNMTQKQYREELANVGLVADREEKGTATQSKKKPITEPARDVSQETGQKETRSSIEEKKEDEQVKETGIPTQEAPVESNDPEIIADTLKNSGKKAAFSYAGYKVRKFVGGHYKGEPYFSYRIDTPNGEVIRGETEYRNNDFFETVAYEISNHRNSASANIQHPSQTSGEVRNQSAPTVDTQNQSTQQGQPQKPAQPTGEMQRERPNSVREQEIPVTDPQGRRNSEFVGNAYTSSLTPDSFTESIKRLVDEGQVSYDVQTNEESLRKGAELIAQDGSEDQAVKSLRDFAEKGGSSPEQIAKATLLYQDLTAQIEEQTKAGRVDERLKRDAEDVFISLQKMATNSGRSLQLFNLFRKMTPDSQVRVLEQEVQNEVAKLQKRGIVKKDYKPQRDVALMNLYREAASEYQKATTDEAKQKAEEKMTEIQNVVYMVEASKLPTTFKAKWDAWRYMAMLGNAKTQFRNFFGNAFMMPYTDAKRAVGAILEKGISQDKRTKSVFVNPEMLAWAKEDRANVKTALEQSAKLGDEKKGGLADNLNTFGSSALGQTMNEIQKKIGDVVSAGDMLFKNQEYSKALAGFLQARGYTAEAARTGAIDTDTMNEARNYAINEALKATFNDANVLSDALTSLHYNGDNAALKALNIMGEGVMPFRKTPANVVMRFKDYSPFGLAQGLWNAAINVRNGKVSAATAIDQISSGLTGSAAAALGYVLAGGLFGFKLTGSGTDEDEKRQGHQDYAIEFSIGGQQYSYKIDWASPSNLPLFLGANLRRVIESEDTASALTAWVNVAQGALEPLLELSCMSSLNDLFEGVRYAEEGEALYTVASKIATSYFTQGIPAIARQTTQALQPSKQTTFVTSEDPVIQKAQKTIAGLGVGNAYKTDKRNAWGETETEGNWMIRAFNAFVNPGTGKKIDNSALEQELTRLNSAQEENVSPTATPKVIDYTDKNGDKHQNYRLTEEEYQKLAQIQGETAKRIVTDIIGSKNYNALSDEQKALAIKLAYEYAGKTAEIETMEDHTGYEDSWMIEMQGKKEADFIINRIANSEINKAVEALSAAWKKGYDDTGRSDALEAVYDNYAALDKAARETVKELATGTAAKYIEARENGVPHDQFVAAAESIAKVKGTGSGGDVRDIDRREAIAKTTGLSAKQIDIIMKAYMEDYDPSDESPKTTELKYDYIREALGLTAAEYAETYKAYLDNGKKNEKVAAMVAMGYDKSVATALYNVYAGNSKGKSEYMGWYEQH